MIIDDLDAVFYRGRSGLSQRPSRERQHAAGWSNWRREGRSEAAGRHGESARGGEQRTYRSVKASWAAWGGGEGAMAEIVSARATAASRPGLGRVWEGEGIRERSQGREEETTGEARGRSGALPGERGRRLDGDAIGATAGEVLDAGEGPWGMMSVARLSWTRTGRRGLRGRRERGRWGRKERTRHEGE